MRVLLTGGGTAGHIYPLLALAEELRKREIDLVYLGSRSPSEAKLVKEAGILFYPIFSGKWRRYWKSSLSAFFLNIFDLFKFLLGFLQSIFLLKKIKPSLVFAKGGYVSLPVVLAAHLFALPIFTHESDVVMGLANKITSSYARKIFISFPPLNYPELPQEKLIYTGNPVRKEFWQRKEKQGKAQKMPTILITGGSQGSEKINQTIYQILPQLLEVAKVIHLTGQLGFEEAKRNRERLKKEGEYLVFDFLEKEMPKVMREADLIISRAGANTLFEIAAEGKPSILIPLPSAASDHQRKNAQIFEKNQAAVLIEEENLSPEKLLKTVKELLKNEGILRKMSENVKKLAKKEAASLIAKKLLEAL